MKNNDSTRLIQCIKLWTYIFYPFFLFISTSIAAKSPELKFLKPIDLPDSGLRINIMPDSKEIPQTPPTVFKYTITKGNKSLQEEKYSPLELWHNNQYAGKWIDKYNNSLTIVAIKEPFPQSFTSIHVSMKEYNNAMLKYTNYNKWNLPDLTQWVSDFIKEKNVEAEVITEHSFRLKNLIRFKIPTGSPYKTFYAFRLNPSASGQYKAPIKWFFILFRINPKININKVDIAIEKKFFNSTTVSNTKANRNTSLSKKFQNNNEKIRIHQSLEFLTSRKQVIDSIRNMKEWWYVATEHYIILSNLKSKHRIMIKDLQKQIELLHSAYSQFLPAINKITAVSVIRIFNSSEEYINYVGSDYKWTDGLWMPSRKELIINFINYGSSKEQKKNIFRITCHEAFHQYIYYAMNQQNTSAWFNEGHAVFFENISIKNNKFIINEDKYKVTLLLDIIRHNQLDLEDIIHVPYSEFYSRNYKTRNKNYTLAWALIYYLRKGISIEKSSPYSKILRKYTETFTKIKNPDKATRIAFHDINIEKFQNDFIEFWTSKNKRSATYRNKVFLHILQKKL